jgi:hypothetical protein
MVWCTPGSDRFIVTFFAYRPPSRPQGSLTPTQPGRVTSPTEALRATLGRLGQLLRQSASRSGVSPSHRPSTGSCDRARSGSTAGPGQRLPPCMCSGSISGAPPAAPALSARTRYELGLSPLSLSTMTTLSGSHVIAGATVAMSSLGSAQAIAMMVGGGGAPPLAAWLGPDWIRSTPGRAPSCSARGCSHVGQAHALP